MNNALDTPLLQIVRFDPAYQAGVDSMRAAIVLEYELPFFHPSSKKIEDMHTLPGHHYWVALAGERVIGTVGIIIAGEGAILKSFFLAKEFRGTGQGVSVALLRTAMDRAMQSGCSAIYLGTMEQFAAAQRFYEKHGYKRIGIDEVPPSFPHNDFDVVFFKKEL